MLSVPLRELHAERAASRARARAGRRRERSGRRTPSSGSGTPSNSIALDPHVVVEVLEVAQPLDRADSAARMPRARSARRGRARARARERRPRAEKPVMPPQRVTSACRQSTAPEQVDGSRPGRTRTRRRRSSSPAGPRSRSRRSPSRSSEETGSSNQVTPHSRVALGPGERLLAREGAVRVDEELDVVADRLARGLEPRRGRAPARARPSSSRAGCPAATQPPSCSATSLRRVRAEAAAAVDRHARHGPAEQRGRAGRRAGAPSGPRARCRPRRVAHTPIPGRPTLRSARPSPRARRAASQSRRALDRRRRAC